MRNTILRISLCLVILWPNVLLAQKKSAITVGLSANSYNGELSSYDQWSSGLSVAWVFNTEKKFSSSIEAGIGSVSGSDRDFAFQTNAGEPTPNTFVETSFLFVNYALRFTFFKKGNISGYLSQGIGFTRFTPKDEFGDNLEDQEDTRVAEEDYRNISFMLPTSLGASYSFENGFGINVQVSLMNTSSDYLDNISEFGDSGSDNILSTRLAIAIPFNR